MGKSDGTEPSRAAGQAEGGVKETTRTHESDVTYAAVPSRCSRSSAVLKVS